METKRYFNYSVETEYGDLTIEYKELVASLYSSYVYFNILNTDDDVVAQGYAVPKDNHYLPDMYECCFSHGKPSYESYGGCDGHSNYGVSGYSDDSVSIFAVGRADSLFDLLVVFVDDDGNELSNDVVRDTLKLSDDDFAKFFDYINYCCCCQFDRDIRDRIESDSELAEEIFGE